MPISVASPEPGLAAPLRALVRAALRSQGARAGEVGIVLTRDVEVRALNRRWRGIDRATDVLSFGYDLPARGRGAPARASRRLGDAADGARGRSRAHGRIVNGDLVISLDRMRVQARRYRVSRARELARLVIHGALHLSGLDHQAVAERARMRAEEERLLRSARATIATLGRAMA